MSVNAIDLTGDSEGKVSLPTRPGSSKDSRNPVPAGTRLNASPDIIYLISSDEEESTIKSKLRSPDSNPLQTALHNTQTDDRMSIDTNGPLVTESTLVAALGHDARVSAPRVHERPTTKEEKPTTCQPHTTAIPVSEEFSKSTKLNEFPVRPIQSARSGSPLSLESFQESLKKALVDLHGDHEYYTRSELSEARRRRDRFLSRSEVQNRARYMSEVSPFAGMQALQTDNHVLQSTGKLVMIQVNKGAKDVVRKIVEPCKHYSVSDTATPPYNNLISTKRNVLVEDDKHRTFLPYHGDHVYVDNDYAKLEATIGQNRLNYHRKNLWAEQAKFYGVCTEIFLAEMGVSVASVLHYLLDDTKSRIPPEVPPELGLIWQNREVHLKDDYYEDSDNTPSHNSSMRYQAKRPQKQWKAISENLPKSTSKELAAAGLACMAFTNVLGLSIWHVMKRERLVLDTVSGKHRSGNYIDGSSAVNGSMKPKKSSDPLSTYKELGCLVCYAHECPGHGEFEDEDDEDNLRVRVNAEPVLSKPLGGAWLRHGHIDPSTADIGSLLGMNSDKTISGQPWTRLKAGEPGFEDTEACSNDCFWVKSSRSQPVSAWTNREKELLKKLSPAYKDARRGACMLALAIKKPCAEIFLRLLEICKFQPLGSSHSVHGTKYGNGRPVQKRGFNYWLENSTTWEHHERQPFKPCGHSGSCMSSDECPCHENGITCEKSCMCADDCSRRYRGCNCSLRGKICWQNDNCDCYRLNRECDPDLCRSCGASEVLDPANRYRDDIIKGRCNNVNLQRSVPRRTLLGESALMAKGGKSGWGLYMGEPVKKGDYICEYVGEVISQEESEQRGGIYNKRNMSYLFELNAAQTLDSNLVGNKSRYINHQAYPHANCQAKTMLCNTIHRIELFACRDIKAGEELMFDYGDGFAEKFDLIKLDDNADPIIEKHRSTPHKGQVRKGFTKNGFKIGRPRKKVDSEQGVKTTGVGARGRSLLDDVYSTEHMGAEPRKSLKRRRSPNPYIADGPSDPMIVDEAVLSEDDNVDESSSESFHESDNDEIDSVGLETAGEDYRSSRRRGGRRRRGRGSMRGRGGKNLGGRPRKYPVEYAGDTRRMSSRIREPSDLRINNDVGDDEEGSEEPMRS